MVTERLFVEAVRKRSLYFLTLELLVSVMPAKNAILHVENDADDVFITQRAFKKAGINVPISSVVNGEEAIAYLLGQDKFANRADYPFPTAILLDWNMPLMSGSQFLAWFKKQPELSRIPVIVLTSSDNRADTIEAYDLGSNGFVVKPSNLEAFQKLAAAFASYWLDWNRAV